MGKRKKRGRRNYIEMNDQEYEESLKGDINPVDNNITEESAGSVETKNIPDAKTVEKKVVDMNVKCPTGIPGFDDLVEGGFPRNSTVLVAGGPGTGKTIFCLEFLIKGALESGEKGLYISFEQRRDDIRNQARQFGWDIDKLEEEDLLKIISVPVDKISGKTIKRIQDLVTHDGFKRLVIDSLSTLVINAPIYVDKSDLSVEDVVGDNITFAPPIIGDYFIQKFLYGFIEKLRDLRCTSLLIGEADQTGQHISRDTLSEFVCDGVVVINFESMGGDYSRSLVVRKMRQTKNNEDVHPLEIGKEGLVVHSIE